MSAEELREYLAQIRLTRRAGIGNAFAARESKPQRKQKKFDRVSALVEEMKKSGMSLEELKELLK